MEGRLKGRQEGRREGFQEGRREAIIEIVEDFVKNDILSYEQISEVLGMSVDEIQRIAATDPSDYSQWRQEKFDDMTLSEIGESAADNAKKHPFKGNATII